MQGNDPVNIKPGGSLTKIMEDSEQRDKKSAVPVSFEFPDQLHGFMTRATEATILQNGGTPEFAAALQRDQERAMALFMQLADSAFAKY